MDDATGASGGHGRRSALVTGAARGIGRAIALALAEAGYDVAVHHRSSPADAEATRVAVEARGRRAAVLAADLLDPDAASASVAAAHAAFGRLDVLVNNVGDYEKGPLLDFPLATWHTLLDSNLTTTLHTCRAAIPLMRDQGGGRIVNLGFAGLDARRSWPVSTAYAIAKTGVAILTRTIAETEAEHGITANVVAPGVIESSRSQPIDEVPAGRVGTVDEVAAAVIYAVSDNARYVTGQTIEVAGGWHLR